MFRKRSDEEHQEGRSHFVILLLFDKAPCLAVEPRESYYKCGATTILVLTNINSNFELGLPY